jgi:hypothetical protein
MPIYFTFPGESLITYVINERLTMNLIPEVVVGLVVAAYVGYYGLVVAVESRTWRKLESSQITEGIQLSSLE